MPICRRRRIYRHPRSPFRVPPADLREQKGEIMAGLYDVTRRLTAPRKRLGTERVRSLLSAGFIILMLGVIGFAVYQVARHMTVGLNTLRTQEITDESYVSLELYIFRDEQPLYAEGSNLYLYDVGNGERVGVGHALGTAYQIGRASGRERVCHCV